MLTITPSIDMYTGILAIVLVVLCGAFMISVVVDTLGRKQ
jgi:hypothetical protein